MEKSEKSERNSNVILLIVIAIATMIIVVIGATFAYLASTTQGSNTANIEATTEGSSDLFLIDAGGNMNINATFENFYDGAGDLKDHVVASVLMQTTGNANQTYDVYLEAPTNDFEYTSGKCYEKSAVVPEYTTKEDCLNGTTNIWAKASGDTEYKCYAPDATLVTSEFYSNNEITCLTEPSYMWGEEEATELALDVYRTTEDTEENCVTADTTDLTSTKGVCVDSKRTIVSAATKGDCTDAGNTWLPNVFENGRCFVVDKTYDITKFITSGEERLAIYSDVEISATADTPARHFYRAEVTLINLPHNQIVNGNKKFIGNLTFETQSPTPTPDTPTT